MSIWNNFVLMPSKNIGLTKFYELVELKNNVCLFTLTQTHYIFWLTTHWSTDNGWRTEHLDYGHNGVVGLFIDFFLKCSSIVSSSVQCFIWWVSCQTFAKISINLYIKVASTMINYFLKNVFNLLKWYINGQLQIYINVNLSIRLTWAAVFSRNH